MLEDFFKVVLILLCALTFVCCAYPREVNNVNETHTRDSVVIERVVKVVNPADSARLDALLECDEHGKVIIAEYNQVVSDNAALRFELGKNGKAIVKFKTLRDTIYLKAKDTYINKVDNVSKEVVKYKRYVPIWIRWYLIIVTILAAVVFWRYWINWRGGVNPIKWFLKWIANKFSR